VKIKVTLAERAAARDSGGPIAETDDGDITITSVEGDQVEFLVNVGPIELGIRGDLTEDNFNGWIVGYATVWIDRRAAEDFNDMQLPVAKLQAYDEVVELLGKVVEL
jgi:hypothetical protein